LAKEIPGAKAALPGFIEPSGGRWAARGALEHARLLAQSGHHIFRDQTDGVDDRQCTVDLIEMIARLADCMEPVAG